MYTFCGRVCCLPPVQCVCVCVCVCARMRVCVFCGGKRNLWVGNMVLVALYYSGKLFWQLSSVPQASSSSSVDLNAPKPSKPKKSGCVIWLYIFVELWKASTSAVPSFIFVMIDIVRGIVDETEFKYYLAVIPSTWGAPTSALPLPIILIHSRYVAFSVQLLSMLVVVTKQHCSLHCMTTLTRSWVGKCM